MTSGLSEILQFIEELTELFDSTSLMAYDISTLLTVIMSFLALIGSILTTGVGVVIFICSLIVAAVTFLALYLINAIPIFVVARKLKYKHAWLAWIPVYQNIFCLYVLYKCPGKAKFELANGKIKIDGIYVFLIYLLFHFFGNAVVTLLIALVNLVPVVGQVMGLITTILYFLPDIVFAIIEYVYLRDLMDAFKPNHKSNCIQSAIVAALDATITFGWANTVYLIILMTQKPLAKAPSANVVVQQAPVQIPVESPVQAPIEPTVEPQDEPPVQSPVEPDDAPVETPVEENV